MQQVVMQGSKVLVIAGMMAVMLGALRLPAHAVPMPLAADPPMGSFELGPIGTPLGTGKLKLEVTVNGVRKDVIIEKDKIKPFVKPKQMAGEANRDYAKRLSEARGEASQAKAKVIADAINETFKTEFEKLGDKAGTGLTIQKDTVRVGVVDYTNEVPFGAVIIPGVSKEQGNPIKVLEGRILGEGGNGGRFIPGARPSPGAKGSLDRAVPGVTTVATGIDPLNDPSVVEIGLGENVARLTPTVGMTDADVLAKLEFLLDRQGLPATFDRDRVELFLDTPVLDGQTFVWGNTDTGLEFLATIDSLQVATVPEPASAVLVLTGLLALLVAARSGRFRGKELPQRRRNRGKSGSDSH